MERGNEEYTPMTEITFTSKEYVGTFLNTSLKLRLTHTLISWPSRIIGLPIQPLIPTAMLIPKICNITAGVKIFN